MKLARYLDEQGLTCVQFGERVGAHYSAVVRWRQGAWPSPAMLVAIHCATDGRVTPNDWLPDPALPEAA